jgi:hypothetical protein
MKRYVFVVDGEVGPDLVFEETSSDQHLALAAALSSSPTVLEVPQGSEVELGWTWDGTNFIAPSA